MNNKDYIAFDDYPGFGKTLLLAIEYMLVPFITLILIVIILKSIHTNPAVEASIISFSIIIYGLITILQAVRFGPIGANLLFPQSTAPTYFAQSILAAKMGGLPLLAGMTIFAGCLQAALSFLLGHIKKVFPNEIADMVILIIGVETALIGAHQLLGFSALAHPAHHAEWFYYLLDFVPFILLIVFDCVGSKNIKLFNLIIVVLISYPLIYFLGAMKSDSIHEVIKSSWFMIPTHLPTHYAFSWDLVIPFTIAVLVCLLKIAGNANALLQINKQEFDLKRISRAAFTDSIGSVLSGSVGSMGLNVSSASIALSASIRNTSRYVAFFMAPLYLFIAVCPKIAFLLIYMPKPITGGILLFIGASLFMMGAKAILTECGTLAKQITVGIPLMFGITYHIYPKLFSTLPSYMNAFTGSALVVATLAAMLLNLFFKAIGKFKLFDLAKN